MEIRIKPLKGEEEKERGEYNKASKDSLFSKGEQKAVADTSAASFLHVLCIPLPGSGFPEFLIVSPWGPRGGRWEGGLAGLLLLQAIRPPNRHLAWAAMTSLRADICGGARGPSHRAKRQIKAAAPCPASTHLPPACWSHLQPQQRKGKV